MARNNYTLKYKRFSQLLAEVRSDMESYDSRGAIDDAQLIKVAIKEMYSLGLIVYMNKQEVFEVKDGKVKLPFFFHSYNFGYLCKGEPVVIKDTRGTHIEQVDLPDEDFNEFPEIDFTCGQEEEPESFDCCGRPEDVQEQIAGEDKTCPTRKVYINKCGGKYEVVQYIHNTVYRFNNLMPLVLDYEYSDNSLVCEECIDMNLKSPWRIRITNGWLYTNFDKGTIYVNYTAVPHDENGNLLVPDHPAINDFLEYALKRRVLENLAINSADDKIAGKLELIEMRYRDARADAREVTLPGITTLRRAWRSNRRAMYNKYFLPYG